MSNIKNHEPLFRIAKNTNIVGWKKWVIRIAGGVFGLLLASIFASIFTKDFGGFFKQIFLGTFGTPLRIWKLFQNTALLLGIAVAITPAFKMKFWNIGAEGQTLAGCLAAAATVVYLGGKVNEGLLIALMLVFACITSIIWAVIPAIFKSIFNTNETLFTLMMNYVATYLVTFFIAYKVTSGSGVLGVLKFGHLPPIANQQYLLNILVVIGITIFMFFYLNYSKHGYELTVVGESVNTAKYVGINVKKVIIRTMILSGLVCGIVAWLIVAGTNFTVSASIVGGRGFTAILVSWLAHFNPLGMFLTAFLVVFLEQGASEVVVVYKLGSEAFESVISGIFMLTIIASEFFINYKIKFRDKNLTKNMTTPKSNEIVADDNTTSNDESKVNADNTESADAADTAVTDSAIAEN